MRAKLLAIASLAGTCLVAGCLNERPTYRWGAAVDIEDYKMKAFVRGAREEDLLRVRGCDPDARVTLPDGSQLLTWHMDRIQTTAFLVPFVASGQRIVYAGQVIEYTLVRNGVV